MHGAKFLLSLALFMLVGSVQSTLAAALPAYAFDLSEHSDLAGVDEATPAAAARRENCLVVWKDNRAATQPYHRGEYLLYGRRFDLAGNPLDAESFALQDEPFLWNNEGLTQPAVGPLGRGYIVVWLTRFRHVSARWISSAGTPASNEVAIARTGDASGQPALASSSRGALVAWTSRTNNNGDIYATLLDRRGNVTRVVPIAADSGNAQHPTVASAGNNFLVVWRELLPSGTGLLKAAVVSHAGEVRPLGEFPERAADWITAAANGRSYFVAWQTCGATSPGNHLMGTLLSARGKVLRDEVMLAACGHEQILPLALRSGHNFTLSWREDPYTAEARMFALTVNGRGLVKSAPMPVRGERGWDGYGTATQLDKSNVLAVLEQKTAAYYENGYLSRVRGHLFPQTQ
jgi:hypothetical protein